MGLIDPRNVMERRGIGYDAETYGHDASIVYDADLEHGSAQVGLAVTADDLGVALAGAGAVLEGVLIKVESDGFCTVQNRGNATVKVGDAATAALVVGAKVVGDLIGTTPGAVKEAAATVVTEATVVQILSADEVVIRIR